MEPISFFVPCVPKPAGSKRAFAIKKGGAFTGRSSIVDASGQKGKDWRGDVKRFASDAYNGQLITGPVTATFVFRFQRPLSHYGTGKKAHVLKPTAPRHHVQAPDALKLARGVEDALTGTVWKDDAQVVAHDGLSKGWCGPDERPGVSIVITPVVDQEGLI